jgi:glycosyltransferase involved in cell wall biosynthesis
VNICTIIARNYLAQARVLASSFKQAHPDGNCTVLVIDDPSGYIDESKEQFEVLTIRDIGLPDADRMAAFYDVMELSTAVKPWLLRTLLDRDGVDSVSYLDPDIRVFSSLQKIEDEARKHGIVLTPHFTKPLPRDGLKPSEEDILLSGSYNLGFIGLGAGRSADELLDWWSERLESDCINEPSQGYFVDQRWIDLAPGFWPDHFLLTETTYNIAYWNLPTRKLEIDGDGYKVDGEPLRFFHFSGYDPRKPRVLSKHQTRVRMTADPALARICDEYGAALKESGYEEAATWPYGWDRTADGIKIDRVARGLFREGVETERFEDSIFTPAGAAKFKEYLTQKVAGTRRAPIGRYAAVLWDSRPDLREAYPDLNGAAAVGFLEWLRVFGPETGVSQELLTPGEPARPAAAAPVAAEHANGATAPAAPARKAPETTPPLGVNVVGYLSSERGVGEVARQVVTALRSRGIPTSEIDTPADPAEIPKALGSLFPADHPYGYNLICVNADMLPPVAAGLGTGFFEGCRSAGLWFWEVSKFPDFWMRSFDEIDEVWAATDYIADALRPLTDKPVRTVRVPIAVGPVAEISREALGMPEGFCFLFVFDYRSVFRRKNPLGLVEAFRKAFPAGSGPSLVIKSVCGDQFPADREKLAAAIADRPEISLVEDTLAVEEKNAMIANCDCYVSLHRSEGLGLTMAEAMWFGKPVIATAYSGNLDFMTDENSYLVPYVDAEIGPEADPYPPDGEWAEPDIEAAAKLMREIVADPEGAASRGRRAAADIRRTHSAEASAASIEAQVIDGWADGVVARAADEGSPADDRLQELLNSGGPPVDRASKQMRDTAKRAYVRALRPYIAYQGEVNQGLDEQTAKVRDGLVAAMALDQRLHARLAELEDRVAEQDAALRDLGARGGSDEDPA